MQSADLHVIAPGEIRGHQRTPQKFFWGAV
nr:MAG TPA: hypothetical protein [Caudoviricetes sp.]